MKNVLIIGFGRLGSNLYYNLIKSGKYKLKIIKEHFKATRKNTLLLMNSEIIILCVQDERIIELIKKISNIKINFLNKYFYHTSGVLTSDVFNLLRKKGCYCSSFHPVQTFAKKTSRATKLFKGTYTAIEGDTKSNKEAFNIANALGSKPYTILAKDKIIHHISCVISSNYLTTLFSKIIKINNRIKINGFKNTTFLNIYMPLTKQSMNNIIEYGIEKSLTGPIARNDKITIKKHLDKLKNEYKEALHFYIIMGIETVKLALKNKSITKDQAKNLNKIFKYYLV